MNFSDMKFEILESNGENYKVWKDGILLQLGVMDIDYAFETSDKALASILIMKFSSARFTSVTGVRDHINKIREIAAQIISESFLVHNILNTLPKNYAPFKISYNTHKDKWSLNELMAMCMQEEGRLTMEIGESALLTTQEKNSTHAKFKGKQKLHPKGDIKKESRCFFCKSKGHMKKNCDKYKKWLIKKGINKPAEASGSKA
ncbi:unnamed protein product [Amaranthus hypochondriacus]